MSENESQEVRNVAELLIQNSHAMAYHQYMQRGSSMQPYDITRTHSINLITEEFLGGYMQDGRMSVVRRFFCLFVTFDLIFVALLWLICIMITGDNIVSAFDKQIIHYTMNKSLFDVVAAALCRFLVLIFFYAVLYINHWLIIALSTSGSCMFLISKVFVYDWVGSHQQVFEVVLIITSFVLSWGEAWFLDCRVIPQERHASRYFSSLSSNDRSPLMPPVFAVEAERRPPDSVANFYSPMDSAHNSDIEEEENDEYHQMGLVCVKRAYELLESPDWKVEKVTPKGDTIRSTQRDKLGKIYRLTAHIKYPARALLEELFYKIENVPKWNPTLLESKIVHKINSYTDITYQATVGGGGGIVKNRDFVNLRCWRLFRNGCMCDTDVEDDNEGSGDESNLNRSCEGSVSTVSESAGESTPLPSSVGSVQMDFLNHSLKPTEVDNADFGTLSKSLGAKGFGVHIDFNEPPPLDDEFKDAEDRTSMPKPEKMDVSHMQQPALKDKVWVSAASSVAFEKVPPSSKYTRGENLVAAFALREIAGKSDACILEWILCLDLKGFIPRYVLDATYTTFMTDYMIHLRNYVKERRQKRQRKRVQMS